GVRPYPARVRLFEREGEGVEDLVGAEPEELVLPFLDVDPEMGLVAVADAAVGAVCGNDEVVVRPVGQVRARLMFEMEPDAQLPRPVLQDAQQALAADADKAMAGGADRLAVNVHVDIVPMGELAG